MIDNLRFVLGGNTGDKTLLLCLGDAETVVGVLDVLGEVFPTSRLLFGRTHEVLDVVEVDARQV